MQSTPFITRFRGLTIPQPLKALTEWQPENAWSLCKVLQVSSPRYYPSLLMSMWQSFCSTSDIHISLIWLNTERQNDKHICVLCHNNHGSIVTGSMFGVKQHACVSFFLWGSKFINDLRAIFSDYETLLPTLHVMKSSLLPRFSVYVSFLHDWQRNLMRAVLLA